MIANSALFLSPLLAFALPALAAPAATCPIVFDGRVNKNATLDSFDQSSSVYNPGYVKGNNLAWSQILQFPNVTTSLYDAKVSAKAVEVTIDDQSIFQSQTGFRRAELLVNGAPSSLVSGVKTVHFSLRTDPQRPLNYSHEYQVFWVETADYSTNQIDLKIGTLFDGTNNGAPRTLSLQGNQNQNPSKVLYKTAFQDNVWYNFAVQLNFNTNTVQVWASTGNAALKSTGAAQANNNGGQGEWHFGILKKPTGQFTDITKEGYQESGIHEGIIFGGIFFEDSSTTCTTARH